MHLNIYSQYITFVLFYMIKIYNNDSFRHQKHLVTRLPLTILESFMQYISNVIDALTLLQATIILV